MSIDDTTSSTVPAGDAHEVAPAPAPAEEQTTRRAWPWVLGGAVVALLGGAILLVTLVDASTIGKDDYVLAPGSATNTADAVIVEGADSFPPEGEIAFTTVAIKRSPSIWEWYTARFDDSTEVVPAEVIDGTRSTEEARQVTQFQMDVSQDVATLVALDYLGYEPVPLVEGAFVVQLVPDSPAEAQLQLGDLITTVNDVPIRSPEDLADVIQAAMPGDVVDVELMRGNVDEGGHGADPNAEPVQLQIQLDEHPDVEGAGFLGVRIETPLGADAPFEVSIDVGRVRGPSAGLAFSLAILDVLTEGELTGDTRVATTGTINVAGEVGAVGGVPQKIEAARREGIELFLVPPSEYVDALAAADGALDVRCVQTFDDAVLVLAEFGGNGVSVAELAGAPAPEASPNTVDPGDGIETCAEVAGGA